MQTLRNMAREEYRAAIKVAELAQLYESSSNLYSSPLSLLCLFVISRFLIVGRALNVNLNINTNDLTALKRALHRLGGIFPVARMLLNVQV